jgi:hypothetical protein
MNKSHCHLSLAGQSQDARVDPTKSQTRLPACGITNLVGSINLQCSFAIFLAAGQFHRPLARFSGQEF